MKVSVLTDSQRASLTRLVDRYQGRIRAFLCRFTSDRDVIDDLTQDVFVGVAVRCEELEKRDPEAILAYLHGVARNMVRERWRRQRVSRSRADSVVRELTGSHWDEKLESESTGMTQLLLKSIEQCVGGLSGESAALVEQFYFKKVRMVDIAKTKGRSDASIRMTLMRVRQVLKRCVDAKVKEMACKELACYE